MILIIKKKWVDNVGDYVLSAMSLVQFILAPLQILLLDSGMMSESSAGTVRVLGSAFFVLLSFYWILKRKALLAIVSYSVIGVLFYISIWLNSNNVEYITTEGFRLTLCTSIPIFLSFVSIRNKQIFFRMALYISLIVVLIGLCYIVMQFTGQLSMKEGTYNMGLGYSLLFPTLYLINCKNKFCLTIGLISVLVVLLAGSRGPLIPIVAFVILRKFLFGTSFEKIKWMLLAFLSVFVFFLLLEYLPLLVSFLQDLGVNSRTLIYLSEGIITSDSGRGEIYDTVIDRIKENPILGYGVFGDRNFVNGVYCHNFFLEVFVDFGVLLPSLLILLICIYYFKILRIASECEIIFFLLLFLASIIPLLVSSSYLIDFRFSLFLGYAYFIARKYFPLKISYVGKNGCELI